MTVRVGFLGTGQQAGLHARSLAVSGADFAFAGAYDADPARLVDFASWTGAAACSDEDEVLGQCDAVYVCAWTSEHPRLTEEAARRALAKLSARPAPSCSRS